MLELFEDGADKREDVVLKEKQNGVESGEKIFLDKGLYDLIVIEEFFSDVLFEKIYKDKEKVDDKFAEGHSASDAYVEVDL